jgi:hypothetical protein
MTTIASILFGLFTLVLVPLLFLAWLTESDRQRARRWRLAGLSQARIATRMGCSVYRVRKLLA